MAPISLSEQQLRAICFNPHVKRLRQERLTLMKEMRMLHGSVEKVKTKGDHLAWRHAEVVKELVKVRAIFRNQSTLTEDRL